MKSVNLRCKRTFQELERVASGFWLAELSAIEARLSVIPQEVDLCPK